VKDIKSGETAFKMTEGVPVKAQSLQFTGGKVWGFVSGTVDGKAVAGFVNMNETSYSMTVTPKGEITVRENMDESTTADDENNNIKGTLSTAFVIRSFTFDGKGNVWATITGTSELSGNMVKVVDSEGNGFVNELGK
jgi:hypothetical protein